MTSGEASSSPKSSAVGVARSVSPARASRSWVLPEASRTRVLTDRGWRWPVVSPAHAMLVTSGVSLTGAGPMDIACRRATTTSYATWRHSSGRYLSLGNDGRTMRCWCHCWFHALSVISNSITHSFYLLFELPFFDFDPCIHKKLDHYCIQNQILFFSLWTFVIKIKSLKTVIQS